MAVRPDAVALTCEGNCLTYGQLNALANRLARHLVQFGVRPDTLLGLFLDRSNELVIAILAILKAGGAYVPIDPAYPADRVAFMLEDARVPVLLTQRKLAGSLPSTTAKVLCVEEVLAWPVQAGEEGEPASRGRPGSFGLCNLHVRHDRQTQRRRDSAFGPRELPALHAAAARVQRHGHAACRDDALLRHCRLGTVPSADLRRQGRRRRPRRHARPRTAGPANRGLGVHRNAGYSGDSGAP